MTKSRDSHSGPEALQPPPVARADRWEHGSEFHLFDYEPVQSPENPPWSPRGSLWGSGRDALRSLIQHGLRARGWMRLWSPSYFCPDVLEALVSTGIQVRSYSSGPLRGKDAWLEAPLESGDVILVVNHFGLGSGPVEYALPAGVEVVEDHSHDPFSPWARGSKAHWCIASLRKTLPLPDGGALWSPSGLGEPESRDSTAIRAAASALKLAAMRLKHLYLTGHPVDKAAFRDLHSRGESQMGEGEISGITPWSRALLPTFPRTDWQARRRANFLFARDLLNDLPGCEVVSPESDSCVPFSLLLVVRTEPSRERLRAHLIENDVFPAILWDLERIRAFHPSDEELSLSRRVLSIHCDARYGIEDMERVCALVKDGLA